jgi:hypothetical protein
MYVCIYNVYLYLSRYIYIYIMNRDHHTHPSQMFPHVSSLPFFAWGVPNNSPTWALFAQQVLDVQLIGSTWRVFREFTGSIYTLI